MILLLLTAGYAHAAAMDVEAPTARVALRAPLTTIVPLTLPSGGASHGIRIDATVVVPAGCDDVGIGAFVSDAHGQWFQALHPHPLSIGVNRIPLILDPYKPLASHPSMRSWTPAMAALVDRAGLFFYSATPGSAVDVSYRVRSLDETPAPAAYLADLAFPGSVATGDRWQLDCVPTPFPTNPFDPAEFDLTARIIAPDGAESVIPGFWWEPMRSSDRGDREDVTPDGSGRFSVRYRPRIAGAHRVILIARWGSGAAIERELAPIAVVGEPWDGFVRVDPDDRRFFTRAGRWYWPIGLNLRSPNDTRSRDKLETTLTPDRGTWSYHEFFARFAAAGIDATEVWMAPWNLGLEWNSGWAGFHGLGRYSQPNAWRLERVLDDALAHGIRVNLVIYNHGQASSASDREWQGSPYNVRHGGPIEHTTQFFTDPRALAIQERYRRYVVARYADHPAILGWKMWSEVNLTAVGSNSTEWHRHAAERWQALDPYDHPVTTHWSDNYLSADLSVVALPMIDFACIDAYFRRDMLAEVLVNSTVHPARGLARFGKPILVSEYGGAEFGAPHPQLAAEVSCAGFAALVSGHAGGPVFWWWEWVDQRNHWGPYGAIGRFIVGEDPRGAKAVSVRYVATGNGKELWCRAWRKPGNILGYVLDPEWGRSGLSDETFSGATIALGSVATGPMTVSWWDADRGVEIASAPIEHPGGELRLSMPAFRHHLAFKLHRR
ncbi:MAG: hypothetical protein H0V44_16080 [Planctomycetes bacterium]|nr:hypothetical protein [Planctomycetota bacterium]